MRLIMKKQTHSTFWFNLKKLFKAYFNTQFFNKQCLENTKLAEIGHSTSKIIHDMATPMAILQMAISTLEKDVNSKESIQMTLNGLVHAEKNIRLLYDELLSQYRSEPIKVDSFSLPELLDNVVLSFQNTTLGKSALWERQDSPKLRLVKGSYNLLYRAISNIVKNALEASYNNQNKSTGISDANKPKITLRSVLLNDTYEIHIHDNGHGIPEASQAAILQGGFTEGKKNGHGLGMRVVSQAMGFHQGELTLHSSKENGSTFILRLPMLEMAAKKKEANECFSEARFYNV